MAMRTSVALAGLLLCACAGQAPAELTAIKDAVDARITYEGYAKHDYRYIPSGTEASGNCAVFAATYMVDAAKVGHHGVVKTCVLKSGGGHAFYETTDGFVLDVRQKFVGTRADVGCI